MTRLLIWGTGAIGGSIGGTLAAAGHDVTVVDRNAAHVAAINADGLRIVGPIRAVTAPVPAFTPETVRGAWDLILLAVKAPDTDAATQALLPHLAPDGMVVSAQNGLNEIRIAEIAGSNRTIGCFVNFGCDWLEPGVITLGNRAATVVGELDGTLTPRIHALHRLLQDFEPDAVLTPNIWGYLWGKLGYGTLLFATALTPLSIADALDSPAHRPVFRALAREVVAVALAQGIRPEAFDGWDPGAFTPEADDAAGDRVLDALVRFNRASTKSHSGIWRDIAVHKRRTEVDFQVAPVVTAAGRLGVPVPISRRLLDLMHQVEIHELPQDAALLDRLAGA